MLEAVAGRLERRSLASGELLVREGEEAQQLFIVVEGRLEVTTEDDLDRRQVVGEMGPGEVVGDVSFLSGGPRSATVGAMTPVELLSLSAEAFTQLTEAHPDLAARLSEQAHFRLLRSQLAAHLTALFGSVPPEMRPELSGGLDWIHLTPGEALYEAGAGLGGGFIVVVGRLQMFLPGDRRSVREFTSGEIIGGGSLLEEVDAADSVIATRDSYLVSLPRATFELMVQREPQAALVLARHMTKSPTSARSRTSSERTCVAIVPVSSGLDVRFVASQIADALRKHGEVFHVWSARADSWLGKAGIAQARPGDAADLRLVGWMYELEAAHRFLVYEADPTPSAWSDRVLRQADHIVYVADGAQAPLAPHRPQTEGNGSRSRPRSTLVVLQEPSASLPKPAAPFLLDREIDGVVQVHKGSVGDLARLARIIGGHAVALVLSGGGARGFGHLGVMKALEEAGLTVDLVGGTSIGAVMGSLLAEAIPVDELVPLARAGFSDLFDYTLPAVAVMKGRRITRAIEDHFGDRMIEDLWLPYFCISSNVTTVTEVVHRTGLMVPRLRASIAIPGVLPPVPLEGDIHVDGGVLNNLPVDVMRRLYPDATIIASDVAPALGPPAREDFGLWVSGFRVTAARLRGGRSKVPGISDTLVRATTIGSMRDRNRLVQSGLADLYLQLDMRGVGLLDFSAVETNAEKGYDLARPLIEGWQQNRLAGTAGKSS